MYHKYIEQAKRKFEEAITINPDCAEAYNGLGLYGLEIKNLDYAKENFGRAIIKNNQYIEALNNYGVVLLKKKDFSEAIKSFESLLKIDKN